MMNSQPQDIQKREIVDTQIFKYGYKSTKKTLRHSIQSKNVSVQKYEDFSQLQIQIEPKSGLEFVLQDTEEFKFGQNLNSNLYCEIPTNLSFTILTS